MVFYEVDAEHIQKALKDPGEARSNPKHARYSHFIQNENGTRYLQKDIWRRAYVIQHGHPRQENFQSAKLHRWLSAEGFDIIHETSRCGLDDGRSEYGGEQQEAETEYYKRLARAGQREMKVRLLKAAKHTCEISKSSTIEVLEAAHIVAHADQGDSSPENGLLLRVDLHRLFDRGLLSIDPDDGTVRFSESVKEYEDLNGVKIALRAGVGDSLRARSAQKNEP